MEVVASEYRHFTVAFQKRGGVGRVGYDSISSTFSVEAPFSGTGKEVDDQKIKRNLAEEVDSFLVSV